MSVVKHSISAYQLSIKGITKRNYNQWEWNNIRLFILNHFFQLYRTVRFILCVYIIEFCILIEEIANHFMIDQHTKKYSKEIQITIIRCGFNQHILQSTAYFHSSYQEDPLLVEFLKAGISALVEINDYDFEFLCFPLYLGSTKDRVMKSEVDQMLKICWIGFIRNINFIWIRFS